MYDVYIIENSSGRLYIGFTSNIDNRLFSHNMDEGPDWTQGRGPWKLIYREEFSDKTEAIVREKYLKGLKAGQRIKKILNIG